LCELVHVQHVSYLVYVQVLSVKMVGDNREGQASLCRWPLEVVKDGREAWTEGLRGEGWTMDE
jgi:hypothetical protein